MGEVSSDRLEALVSEAKASGGSEMANYQLFVERLTGALGLPQPAFAREETRFNDYVFERNVTFRHPNGTSSTGRIDCYKRGCFVLEAKQSAKRQQAVESDLLARADAPITVPALAAAYAGRASPKRRERVEQVLETLVATGAARCDAASRGYYLPR